MEQSAVTEIHIPELKLLKKGKVRRIFALGDRLLIVATDCISAFDVVLPDGIPGKGQVLTTLSAFWFRKLEPLVPNHLISVDPEDLPEDVRGVDGLTGRAMLVRRAEPLPFENIVRGYLVGNGWKEYQRTGRVSGVALPPGLSEGQQLASPIFTPTTKAPQGDHDEPVPFENVVKALGEETAVELRNTSLRLYAEAQAFAHGRGIIIADTKFEFALSEGRLLLIDECLTPDSSRFWPAESRAPGKQPVSLDKQYVRDYLTKSGWDKKPPAPRLPDDVIRETRRRYEDILERLTG